MSEKVLVTYATKYGSTHGVAEAVAGELRMKGADVDLLPAREVRSLEGYAAVVIGSPLYIGMMLSDASRFFSRFKDDLQTLPTALFVLGPLYNTTKDMTEVKTQLDIILGKMDWFHPASVQVFTGAMDLEKFRFPDSLLKMMPASKKNDLFKTYDGRDWDAIKQWAGSLDEALLKIPA